MEWIALILCIIGIVLIVVGIAAGQAGLNGNIALALVILGLICFIPGAILIVLAVRDSLEGTSALLRSPELLSL